VVLDGQQASQSIFPGDKRTCGSPRTWSRTKHTHVQQYDVANAPSKRLGNRWKKRWRQTVAHANTAPARHVIPRRMDVPRDVSTAKAVTRIARVASRMTSTRPEAFAPMNSEVSCRSQEIAVAAAAHKQGDGVPSFQSSYSSEIRRRTEASEDHESSEENEAHKQESHVHTAPAGPAFVQKCAVTTAQRQQQIG
jgi:hypothetical protein